MQYKNALLVLAALAALAPAALADDAQKAIQAQYDKRATAATKKDALGSLSINAPEFVSIGIKGDKRALEELKVQLPKTFGALKSFKVTTKITKFSLQGDKATVKIHDNITMVGKGTQESEATSEDTWIKRSGQWLRTQSKLLSNRIKPSKPSSKPGK